MTINPIHFFSFGGGVQSTAIALMLIHQPHRFSKLPDYIMFADPGAESPQTYQHIDRVFELLEKSGFKIVVVKPDTPIDESEGGLRAVPWFSRNKYSGEVSLLRRQCTREYKIDPLQKKMRELLGFAKGKRIPIGSAITWLGLAQTNLDV